MPAEKPDYGTIAAKTAMSRRTVSVPTRELISSGRIPPDATVLNHGRGRADADAQALASAAAQYAEYDPNYAPDRDVLQDRYDVVVSNYVLNVLPPDIRKQAWEDIARSTGGTAYITVRSTGDKSIRGEKYKDGVITSSGTFQKPFTAEGLVREAKRYFKTVEVILGRKGGISWTIAASGSKLAGEGEPQRPNAKSAPKAKMATTQKANTRLGSKEADVLDALRQHGSWHPDAGWMWDTPGRTKKVMDALVRKGYAQVVKNGAQWLGHKVDIYVPTMMESVRAKGIDNDLEAEINDIKRRAGIAI